MNFTVCRALPLLLTLIVLSGLTVSAVSAGSLFNGRDLSGWTSVNLGPESISIADGVLTLSGSPAGFLRTDEQYQNFVLELEWRHAERGGNSGVMVWADGLPAVGAAYPRSIEIQMLDHGFAESHPDGAGKWFTTHGDIFPIRGAIMTPTRTFAPKGNRSFPREEHARPSPEWNHYRVECIDGSISLTVNGTVVTTAEGCIPRKGYICLQSEAGAVQFRNIRLQSLPGPDLDTSQTADTAEGFVPLLNGRDATGWTFAGDGDKIWTVNDNLVSAISVQVPRGVEPNLWTETAYRNFTLIADWRLPRKPEVKNRPSFTADGLYERDVNGKIVRREILDAGDSGIYLRGSSRYQVNIWCQPMGSGDINELHKDAEVPADVRRAAIPRMKADNPMGEWNRFIITLVGDRLTVLLNGTTVIDDAWLPDIPAEGPIALQHEYGGSPVEFRNLFLKQLPE